MYINELLKQKNITKYRLSKNSGVPYATLNDICSGKTRLEKCSAETVYKLAQGLDVSVEVLIEPYIEERYSFELYKSNICHLIKKLGDTDFMIETIEKDDITRYYHKKWYPESFYLLAMLDYISRRNNIPLCRRYNNMRQHKLKDVLYPSSVIAAYEVSKDISVKERAVKESIPEFMRFNIVESDVENVV